MMNNLIKQKGVGLIEVLITTVVVALGALALAQMQGAFYSSSGESKTRAEALVIAEQEMERLRNMVQVGDYTTLPAVVSPVDGTNATFTVAQGVVAQTSPTRKQLTVTVSWGAGGTDEQIIIASELVFSDPKVSVSFSEFGEGSSGGFGNAPSPNQNASESVEQAIDLFDDNGDLKSGFTADGNFSSLYTDADGNIYKDDGNNKTGTLAVYCTGLSDFDVDLINPLNYDNSTGLLNTSSLINLKVKRIKGVDTKKVIGETIGDLLII